jgi:hypothetical protein
VNYADSRNFNLAARVSSGGNDAITGVAVDGNSNVYITGYNAGIANFYPMQDMGGSAQLDAYKYAAQIGGQDIFIQKLVPYAPNNDGTSWIARIGSSGTDTSFIDVDNLGSSIYVAGNYGNNACAFYDQNDGLYQYSRFYNIKAATAGGFITRFPLISGNS